MQNGVWENATDLVVGYKGSGGIRVSGGRITSKNLVIGDQGGGAGRVMLDAPGSFVSLAGDLVVGNSGSGSLVINQSGTVKSYNAYVGEEESGKGDVTIGNNGTWEAANVIYIGNSGTGTLLVQDNGVIKAAVGSIGGNSNSHGTATLRDSASWINTGNFYVGDHGTGTMTLTDNAYLKNAVGYIGYGIGGSKGTVNVTGTAVWENTSDLYVGNYGAAELNIEQSGTVKNINTLIAHQVGSSGAVTVKNDAKWETTGLLHVGQSGTGTLMIQDGGSVKNTAAYIATNIGSSGTVTVKNDADWNNTGNLFVGYSGTATLLVQNSGTVKSVVGFIGNTATGNGTVTLSDKAAWINTSNFVVADLGTATLNIGDTAYLQNVTGYVGNSSSSAKGTVNLTGTAVWNNTGYLYIGQSGTGMLYVQDSGTVKSVVGFIGSAATGNGTVTLSDKAAWINTSNFVVADLGTGTLNITGGAYLENNTGFVGNNGAASNGTVNVSGTGFWKNTGNLLIGVFGTGELNITQSGTVQSIDTYIARNNTGKGAVNVSGTAVWNNTGNIHVGHTGTGSLIVQDSGTVKSVVGFIGNAATGNGIVTLSDKAAWIATGNFVVAELGTGTLNITGGAYLENNTGFVGNAGTASKGTVNVSGTGFWKNTGNLLIGVSGTGELNITQSGTVQSIDTYIARNNTGKGAVNVSGTAVWNNTGNIHVGHTGTGSLIVQDSGTVKSAAASIGTILGSRGTATLQDDARWENTGNLTIGAAGNGTLTIDGASLAAAHIRLADTVSSAASLTLTNSGTIEAAGFSAGNLSTTSLAINGGVIVATAANTDYFANLNFIGLDGTGLADTTPALAFDTAGNDVTIASTLGYAPSGGAAPIALEKRGDGLLTTTGNLNLSGGILNIVSGSLRATGTIGAAAIAAATDTEVILDTAADWTYSGYLSGEGTITKAGTGTLALTADNTAGHAALTPYAGTLNLAGGVLKINDADALGALAKLTGTATLAIDNAGAFTFSASNASSAFDGTIRLQNNTTLAIDDPAGANHTILQTATLELAAGGLATIATPGTHISDLAFTGGALDLSVSMPPSELLHIDGTLTVQSGTLIARVATTGTATLPARPPFPDQDNFMGQSTTLNPGSVLLLGADTISGDITQLTLADASGALPAGSATTAYYNAGTHTVDAIYDYTALTGTNSGTAGLWLTYALTQLDIKDQQTLDLHTDDAGSDRTLAARITGPGSLTISATGTPVPGANHITLSHANNTYTGTTTITAGNELRGGNHNINAASAALVLEGDAAYDTGAYHQAIQSLRDDGAATARVTISDTAATLTLTGSTDGAYTGTLDGAGNLVKTGAATQTLANIDITGVTYVATGTLNVHGSIAASATNAAALNVTGSIGAHALNTGTLAVVGDIGGSLLNDTAGTVLTVGDVAHGIYNAGHILAAGDILADGLVNTGTLVTIGTITGGAQNTGTIGSIAAIATGGIYNAAAAAIDTIGSVTGDISNAGHIAATGAVQGNIYNTGTLAAVAAITGDLYNATLQSRATITGNIDGNTINEGRLALTTGGIGGWLQTGTASETAIATDIGGHVWNSGTLAITGDILGGLQNAHAGRVTTLGNTAQGIDNAGLIDNAANVLAGGVINRATGRITRVGTVTGDIQNAGLIEETLAVTGNVANTGTLTVNGAISGTLANAGHATTRGIVTGLTSNTGTLAAHARLAGGLANTGHVTFANTGTLVTGPTTNTGHITLAAGPSQFAGNVTGNRGTIRYADATAGPSAKITIMGNLSGSQTFANAAVDLAATAHPLLLDITGTVTGTHTLQLVKNPATAMVADPEHFSIALVRSATAAGIITANPVEDGMWTYELQAGDGGSLMPDKNQWYLSRGAQSRAADAILGTAASLGNDWHYTLDTLHQRMGELRAAPAQATANGNVWVRTHAYQLNAAASVAGRPFEQTAYGVTAGADKALTNETRTLLLGGFVQMGRSDRDHDYYHGESSSDELGIGTYGTWLLQNGWFIDATLKFSRIENNLDIAAVDGHKTTATYNNQVQGMSLELGRRLEKNGYWVEPTVQMATAWINGQTYTTNNNLRVTIDDSDAWQYRAQLRAGATYDRWLPYAKAGMTKSDTNGGEVEVQGGAYNPNFDGWRMEAGFGTSYIVDEQSQLYLYYEYAKAAAYERPWSLNIGYRRAW